MSEISENLKTTLSSVKKECERLKKAADEAMAAYKNFLKEIKDVCEQDTEIESPAEEAKPVTASKNSVHPIKLYCDKYGWSANDFAGHFGVAYASVRRWQDGDRVTPKSLEKIKAEDKKLAKEIAEYQEQHA